MPPKREQIDGNVQAFQALSDAEIVVLGTDGNLWLEHAPFRPPGPVPPKREQIDGNVQAFQARSDAEIVVLGTDGNLWLEHAPFRPPGPVPPKREQIDGNVMRSWAQTRLEMQYQLMSNWCWIAVATSISHFYNPASTWTQCSLATAQLQASASLHMQGQCCPDAQLLASTSGLAAALANPYSSNSLYALDSVNSQLAATPTSICNHSGDVGKALTQTGNLYGGETGSTVGMTDLLNELNAGHPVCIYIEWAGGGAHQIAASGVELPNTMIVEDPIFGRSILPYQTVASSYQGNGSWTSTAYTKS